MTNSSVSTTFQLGGDLSVNRLGYGAMRLTGQPGNFGPYADWEGGKQLLRRAVELGINFIDTAEAYGPGTNEEIIADALVPYAADLVIATKGGIHKPAPDNIQTDGRPESLRRGVEGSLQRLKRDVIDLYHLHRPDPKVPFTESIQALAALQQEGKIRHIGISNVTLEQVQAAQSIVPIASVQNRFSLTDRSHADILDYTTTHHIAFIPYGSLGAHPLRRGAPLAQAEGILAQIAQTHKANPTQIALAWLLHRAPNILLIPGTTTIAHLEDNIQAAAISLSEDEMAQLRTL
ncbi:aldo/keto reductase [Leptolyngbya cf. ectocarpi LEGE 11479]|uniref:Aldo/keto reductase n=1 Tax=Leptolyngbya cf. ectocarpi LEGE 11479 TaxID=1828722 RepID=A0A928ZUU8_LEPEC|nr:aldo/keto reductase [Leptolyngbya ectocarpi]MBE9067864.1 aldo/keto reductase [Leptolyngbya cf. ectocarpi LEGE 11479]